MSVYFIFSATSSVHVQVEVEESEDGDRCFSPVSNLSLMSNQNHQSPSQSSNIAVQQRYF